MTIPSLHKYTDFGLLVLRVVVGAVFIYHGLMKWSMSDPNTIFSILRIVEPLGGIALILGALTQYASIGLCIIMLGAMYMKMTGFGQGAFNPAGTFAIQGGTGWEFDVTLFAAALSLALMGAGKLSVDAMVKKS